MKYRTVLTLYIFKNKLTVFKNKLTVIQYCFVYKKFCNMQQFNAQCLERLLFNRMLFKGFGLETELPERFFLKVSNMYGIFSNVMQYLVILRIISSCVLLLSTKINLLTVNIM